ncbi:MAG TPA: TetR/AcrR family transcriptional regulator [Phenylobacterium sp.]|jgi:AcrR family transcriptional regulator|uniref:TetR/AcrR family transcriptional regulator n=1 Tax=Phenylobacterium sp. TaxID=1871053 RepID=UPI002C09797D|nr:TetR/AcrR family transcriptional regulator [Phenylobacterium sp.]HXA38042.1 TetR/AcrR family transcriptional regulator [Phenylobacterium sp.]
MPRVLSDTDVADFRERLCAAAERLFAERGPDAVTMRQLAAELGVSPMTPYRYFEDKEDILAAVRANGLSRFAEALETARATAQGARAIGSAVGEAYVDFALSNPHAYKLMFDVNQPHVEKYPELVAAGQRAQKTMTGFVEDALKEGLMAGDPQQIGLMFWAAIHGAVILELAGMLPPGGARQLHRSLEPALMRGVRPQD